MFRQPDAFFEIQQNQARCVVHGEMFTTKHLDEIAAYFIGERNEIVVRAPIPQILRHSGSLKTQDIVLNLDYFYNRQSEYIALHFELNGAAYFAQADDVERAFIKLDKQLNGQYIWQNCYGCQFGDYGVYGNGTWGDMLCFWQYRATYWAVAQHFRKSDYVDFLATLPENHFVAETACCEHFCARQQGSGYRG